MKCKMYKNMLRTCMKEHLLLTCVRGIQKLLQTQKQKRCCSFRMDVKLREGGISLGVQLGFSDIERTIIFWLRRERKESATVGRTDGHSTVDVNLASFFFFLFEQECFTNVWNCSFTKESTIKYKGLSLHVSFRDCSTVEMIINNGDELRDDVFVTF